MCVGKKSSWKLASLATPAVRPVWVPRPLRDARGFAPLTKKRDTSPSDPCRPCIKAVDWGGMVGAWRMARRNMEKWPQKIKWPDIWCWFSYFGNFWHEVMILINVQWRFTWFPDFRSCGCKNLFHPQVGQVGSGHPTWPTCNLGYNPLSRRDEPNKYHQQ